MLEPRSIENRLAEIERQLRDLRAAQLPRSSIGSGGLRVHSHGKITVEDAAGNVLVDLDSAGVDIFESDGSVLVAITGTGIRLNDGSGTKLIDLTTAYQQVAAITFDPPDWVQTLFVMATATGQFTNNSGSDFKAYESDGSTLLILDGSKLRYNRSDGTRSLEITPASGLKIYAADGTTEKVVLDATGLEVDGGNVQAVWLETGDDTAQNVSLTTTYQQVAAITFDPPDWVQTLFVMATATGQFTNNTGSDFNGLMRMTLDHGGASAEGAEGSESAPNGTTAHFAITEVLTVPLSPAGRTVDVTLDARVNNASTAVNLFGLKVLAFGVRSAFV